MKKTIITLIAIVTIVITSVSSPRPYKPYQQPKKYSASYTREEWQSRIKWMENAKEIMRSSSLPGNVIAQWQDSLTLFQQEISQQVGQQIAADTTKPKKN